MKGAIGIFLEYYRNGRGENVILSYIVKIDNSIDALEIEIVLDELDRRGAVYIQTDEVATRHMQDKMYEMKISRHRIFYMYATGNRVILLHVCQKQKRSTEKMDMELGLKRMREMMRHHKEK